MGAAVRKKGRAPARPWTRKNWELRQRLEQAIEDAIAALDAFDGDADFEPWLGAPQLSELRDQALWSQGANDDRELDGSDDEPSLGASERLIDQTRWTHGSSDQDLEDQCEDEGAPSGDDEPSLGWPNPGWGGNVPLSERWPGANHHDHE